MRCIICGKEFVNQTKHPDRKYCSDQCRAKANRERYSVGRPKWRELVSTATTGAVHEIQVAADLLKRGYHVFRSMSPACPCDLICMKGDISFRVEVTTGIQTPEGDILAVVVNDEIHYTPELESNTP